MDCNILNIIEPDTPISDAEGIQLASEIHEELLREDIINSFIKTGRTVMKTTAKKVLHDSILGVRPIETIQKREKGE